MERGHDMVYVCYDNGAYMNTGINVLLLPHILLIQQQHQQGSIPGKMQTRKDLTKILAVIIYHMLLKLLQL